MARLADGVVVGSALVEALGTRRRRAARGEFLRRAARRARRADGGRGMSDRRQPLVDRYARLLAVGGAVVALAALAVDTALARRSRSPRCC